MQAKTVGQQTRNRNLIIPARAGRSTFLCGLCALCGEFFLRGEGMNLLASANILLIGCNTVP